MFWSKLAYEACKFSSEIIIPLVCKNRNLKSCETQTYQVVGDCTDSNSFSSHSGKPVTQLIEVQFWSGHNHCFQYSLLTSCKKEESCENVRSIIITWQTSRRSATRLGLTFSYGLTASKRSPHSTVKMKLPVPAHKGCCRQSPAAYSPVRIRQVPFLGLLLTFPVVLYSLLIFLTYLLLTKRLSAISCAESPLKCVCYRTRQRRSSEYAFTIFL